MKSPLDFVRSHLKATFLFTVIIFLGFIYFVTGLTIWLFVYLLVCLLFLYITLIHNGGFERTFFLKVFVLFFPVIVGLMFLLFLEVN